MNERGLAFEQENGVDELGNFKRTGEELEREARVLK